MYLNLTQAGGVIIKCIILGFLVDKIRKLTTLSLNAPPTQIWVREASKFQIRNNRWMN